MGHTPGPWIATSGGCVVGADSTLVVAVPRPKGTGATAKRDANARLIAAAPDLLAVCELALSHVEELREAFRSGALTGADGKVGLRANNNVDVEVELRKQIAKAKGN